MALNKDERAYIDRILQAQIYAGTQVMKEQVKIFEEQKRELREIGNRLVEIAAQLEERTFFSTIKRWFRVYRKH